MLFRSRRSALLETGVSDNQIAQAIRRGLLLRVYPGSLVVPSTDFDGAEARSLTFKAGPRELTFSGAAFVPFWMMPNFYFHMTTAYNILRHNGVELGKADFLGGA